VARFGPSSWRTIWFMGLPLRTKRLYAFMMHIQGVQAVRQGSLPAGHSVS
jgi:hypothetical protein